MNEQKIILTIESTWMIYDFIKEGVHYCCVDILILTIERDKFIPKCMPSGKAVSVGIIVPTFLFQYDRLKQFTKERLHSTRTVIRKIPLKRLCLIYTVN